MISVLKKYITYSGLFALIALMLLTRVNHIGSALSLPDASLIIFFLSGVFFNRLPLFIFLLIEAALIDYVVTSQFNISDFCISPAYIGLIPTYGVMWLAGGYCAKFKKLTSSEIYAQFAILFLATTVAFLISNGSFYLFSGKISHASWTHYLQGIGDYYPAYLSATLLYGLVIGVGIKLIQTLVCSSQTKTSANIGE